MTQQNEQRTVIAKVGGKKETDRGMQVELEIPEFKSQYPTPVLVSSQIDNLGLRTGLTYNVVLKRENLKKGKAGEKPWDYYWGWVGFAPGSEGAVDPSPFSPSLEPARAGKEWKMRDEDAIARNTVLQAVGQIVASVASNRSDEDILSLCRSLHECLLTLRLPPSLAIRGQEVTVTSWEKLGTPIRGPIKTVGVTSAEGGKESQGFPTSVVELFNMGLKLGYKSKAGMLTALGYKHESEITDVAAAWITLQEVSKR